jgi:hypothetical protein
MLILKTHAGRPETDFYRMFFVLNLFTTFRVEKVYIFLLKKIIYTEISIHGIY